MDKVHALLAVLKKQHFWVLCALILIASTVVWMMAVGDIEAEAQQNQQRIKVALEDAKQVVNVNQHPNDQITAAYNQQTAKLKQDVFVVWNSLYKKQRDTVLKWPPALGEDFIKHVDNTPFMGEIPVDFRDIYFNYVKTRWAEIPKIIKARAVSADDAAGSRGRAPSTRKAIPDYIVVWADQERIRKELFSTLRPTTEWVWLTQEDLWIYENLLNVIKKTNAGAIGPHNAVISTIDAMDVGKTAAQDAGGKGQRIALTGGDAEDAAGGTGSSSGSPAGLLNGRYVDATGVPLENGTTAGDDEYKRIPVRLALQMDAREIPLLILNCANAPLPVEVQQVRVNVNSDKSSAVKSPDLSAEDRAAGRKTPHVEVSLQGVIYIFNPPNRKKLGLPLEETSGTAVEAFATEGATETPTPTFDEEPAVEGTPTATDAAADPMSTPAAGTPAVPAATGPAPPAGVEGTEAPAGTTPAATGTAPPAESPKEDALESLFDEDTTETAPANP